MLLPKLVTTLKTYTRAQLVSDLTAGFIVGIVALPLAIAFAIASGLTPERGLYTAVIAGFLTGTAVAQLLDLPVETIGSRFGEIHAGLPRLMLPSISLGEARELVGPALAIATLAAVESLLSAVVADGMIGGRHRSNMELVAQGTANVIAPLFGGMPATGAIARTATNVKSGGRTPVAGIAHSITLLVITLFFGRWAGLIPLATLAAIVLSVAYRMGEWRVFKSELSAPKSDALVMVATFLLTVLVDLTVGIGVGMVLAAFLFMKRMAEVTNVTLISRELQDPGPTLDHSGAIYRRKIPAGVEVYEINGPFFFGAAEKFKDTLSEISKKPKVLIIRMRHVPAIDSTAMHALRDLVRRTRRDGTVLFFSDVHAQPLVALGRSALLDEIGEENVFGNIDEALAMAQARL